MGCEIGKFGYYEGRIFSSRRFDSPRFAGILEADFFRPRHFSTKRDAQRKPTSSGSGKKWTTLQPHAASGENAIAPPDPVHGFPKRPFLRAAVFFFQPGRRIDHLPRKDTGMKLDKGVSGERRP